MKLWIDDVRPAPSKEYMSCSSVNMAKRIIQYWEKNFKPFELIDIDLYTGDYFYKGGDYIKLFDWLKETGRNYPIRIHSMNPVGRENIRAIIRRNGWTEVM